MRTLPALRRVSRQLVLAVAIVLALAAPAMAQELTPQQQSLVLLVEISLGLITVFGAIIFFLMFRDIVAWRPRYRRAPDADTDATASAK